MANSIGMRLPIQTFESAHITFEQMSHAPNKK